ncbi:MAG: F0F1 ATP synthase subunit B [Leptolyngbyaceae cyanobacterium bins.302]|nr:F0F1 ATP synthase subunit B [Leptolyngbyaceae cyanobacterium bins.302]
MSMLGNFVWLVAEAGVEASEGGGFGLNFDILETNLVNLTIVIGVVIYFGRGFLGKALGDRRSAIEAAIKEAEERRQQAAAALAEEQQKLAQAQQEATRIRAASEERAAAAKAAILEQSEQDIQRLRESVSQDVDTERARAIAELRQRVTALALQKAEAELPSHLNDDVQRGIIDRSIAMLGGAS